MPTSDHQEIGPPPLSPALRRLAVAWVSVHTAIALTGTALSPYLAVNHPLLLVLMAPDLQFVLLAAPQLDPALLLAAGTARRATVQVAMYAIGALWGFIAIRWAGRRSPRAARLIGWMESLFGRLGLPLLVVVPAYAMGVLAGASRTPFWAFLAATTVGQLLATWLTAFAGDQLGEWIQRVLAWLGEHVLAATVVAVLLVLAQQLYSRRSRQQQLSALGPPPAQAPPDGL